MTYTFESESQGRVVQKSVEFTFVRNEIYNLAFGDLDENGDINDLKVTNNKDMELVLATVIRTILVFFETYPDKTVFFTGSTPSRTRLYQIIVKREHETLSQQFVIKGIREGMLEIVQMDKNYTAFFIRVKN